MIGIEPWDIAAGGLLVREAGGRATFTAGDEEFISTGTIVVSNGLPHEQMLPTRTVEAWSAFSGWSLHASVSRLPL